MHPDVIKCFISSTCFILIHLLKIIDPASSLLATLIGADEFYILTDVPYIYINYKKPGQQIKEFLNYEDDRR